MKRTIMATLVTAAALAACSDATSTGTRVPDATLGYIPGLPAGPTTVRLAEVERVEVCKDFVMTSGAPAPASASFTANGNAFTLANGACKETWIAGGAGELVTVSETPMNGYTTTIRVTDLAGNVSTVNGTSTSVTPSGLPRAGYLLEFINTEEVNTGGCTLTLGYWKTHSSYGPAPSDPVWASVGGPDATFYYSGKSWYALFWTPPSGGNAYIQLAHQFMAAVLNVANGASTDAATATALTGAKAFFNNSANTPSTSYSKAQVNALRAWASTLDSYNQGITGPGHCS